MRFGRKAEESGIATRMVLKTGRWHGRKESRKINPTVPTPAGPRVNLGVRAQGPGTDPQAAKLDETPLSDAGEQGLARSKLDETPSIGRGMGGFGRHFALPLCYL